MPRINFSQAEKDTLLHLWGQFEANGHHRRWGVKKELAALLTRSGARIITHRDVNAMLDELQSEGKIGPHHVEKHTNDARSNEGSASFLMAMSQNRTFENIRRYGLDREKTIRPQTTRIAFFTDQHASVGLSNERFTWFGRFLKATRPDAIVSGGDWCNWDCFSGHEKAGTVKYAEKPTYPEEFAVFKDSVERITAELPKGYSPELYHVHGNHEHRAWVHEDLNPVLGNMFTSQIEDVFEQHHWQTSPYGAHIFVHGVKFTHNDLDKRGKPKGDNAIIKDADCDQGSGHKHTLMNSFITRGTQTYRAFRPGCFLPYGHRFKYAPHGDDYWYGLQMVTVCDGKVMSVKEVSMPELEADFA